LIIRRIILTDQDEQDIKKLKREEKRAGEEARNEARSLERRKANLAKEQAIEKNQEERRTREAIKHAEKETARQLKEDERRKANIAREEAIAKDLEARKLRGKKK
jgi:hypothetical protein